MKKAVNNITTADHTATGPHAQHPKQNGIKVIAINPNTRLIAINNEYNVGATTPTKKVNARIGKSNLIESTNNTIL